MIDANFNGLAADYAAYRTGYSSDLVAAVAGFGALPGRAILDIACGTGIATAAFADRGCVMTGLDPSSKMLEAARERLPQATFVEGRAEALPFDDNSFDGAICAQAFHWFDKPRAFAEAIRVVRPGGPVAAWWKMLAHEEPIRDLRASVVRELEFEPLPDSLAGGFSEFYAAPFVERALRVMPFLVHMTAAEWVGYERSRRRLANAYGEAGRERYLDLIERRLAERFGTLSASMTIRYVQYLYTGFVAP